MDDVTWLPDDFEFEYVGPAFYSELEEWLEIDRHEPDVHLMLEASNERERWRVITKRDRYGRNSEAGYINEGAVEVCPARHPTRSLLCRISDVAEEHIDNHHWAEVELKGPRSGGWVWTFWDVTEKDLERWRIQPT